MFDPRLGATTEFIAALPHHLAADGRAYLLTSDVFERCGFSVEALSAAAGLAAELLAVHDCGYEQYRVHRITWPDGSGDRPC